MDELIKIEDSEEFFKALKESGLTEAEQDAIIIARYKYLYQKYRPSEEHFEYVRSKRKGK